MPRKPLTEEEKERRYQLRVQKRWEDAKIKLAELEKEHPELLEYCIDDECPPTLAQVDYALELGIVLEGQSKFSISKDIDKAKKNKQRSPFHIPAPVIEVLYEKLRSLPSRKDEVIPWGIRKKYYYEHLLFPENTTWRQLNKALSIYYNRLTAGVCPKCNTRIYQGEGEYEVNNRCPKCNKKLNGYCIIVEFDDKGRPHFEREFYPVYEPCSPNKKNESKGLFGWIGPLFSNK